MARVTVDKPDEYNVMTLSTVEEMFRAFYDANHDTSIGMIVVAGSGRNSEPAATSSGSDGVCALRSTTATPTTGSSGSRASP
ncbi:MAG: hypothetical protein M5U19_20955 [Microthrixaceae bacterium]|nr:hypothetical protein [Microthrixaceae bacterium]